MLVLLHQAELLLTLLHWTSHLQLLEGFAAGGSLPELGAKIRIWLELPIWIWLRIRNPDLIFIESKGAHCTSLDP